jgi:transposase
LRLFVDGSIVIEVPMPAATERAERTASAAPEGERRRAVRVHLPRAIDQIDVPEAQKICRCCVEAMSPFGDEASEQLRYIPAGLEVHKTRR